MLLVCCAGILLFVFAASPAQAYIGPGGGLSFLTTALAMLGAFAVATTYLVRTWVRTIKSWFRRDEAKQKTKETGTNEEHEEHRD